MNKTITSIAITVVFVVAAIIFAVLFKGCSKAPEGTDAIEKMLEGCNSRSESAILANFTSGDYLSVFSSCVTPDDYLRKCGVTFDYMSDEGNVTERFYLIGTASAEEGESSKDVFSGYTGTQNIEAYIAADYKDSEGNAMTVMTTASFTMKDGKICYVY